MVAFLLSFTNPPRGIYDLKIKNIDGALTPLSNYYGKKMVFVVLKGNETDSAFDQLTAFCTKYKDSAVVFGILSIEDGYKEADKGSVNKRYKSKVPGLVLTEGMYTRKASAGQADLMSWFTHASQNGRYDQDITGAGWKFFVDETGVLYAALNPQATFSSTVIQRVMSKPARKRPQPPVMQKGRSIKKVD